MTALATDLTSSNQVADTSDVVDIVARMVVQRGDTRVCTEHQVRYCGCYSNRSRDASRMVERDNDLPKSTTFDERTIDA